VINPEAPEDVTSFGCGLFQEFHELPDFNAILFVDPLGMETIKKEADGSASPASHGMGLATLKSKATRSKVKPMTHSPTGGFLSPSI
jgi:hypothetical protein